MILDAGIVTIFAVHDEAEPGNMPVPAYSIKYQSWYGELDYEAGRVYRTDNREDVDVQARIRIVQNREITNHDVLAYGMPNAAPEHVYRILRAYHGTDDDNGQPITDLTIQAVMPQ